MPTRPKGRPTVGRKPRVQEATSKERCEVDSIRAEALKLRLQGWTLRQIAEQVNRTHSTVYEAITRELAQIKREPATQLLEMELERLDNMLKAVWHRIEDGDTTAVDAGLKIMARRSKYLGLDAPVKVAADMKHGGGETPVRVHVTEEQAMAELMQEIQENPGLLAKLKGET